MIDAKDEKLWATLCHLSALTGFVLPLGNIIGPLMFWFLKKNEMPLVDANGKEALNFQIGITAYFLIVALALPLRFAVPLLVGIAFVDLFLTISACVKVSKGELYRYPLTIRLIK